MVKIEYECQTDECHFRHAVEAQDLATGLDAFSRSLEIARRQKADEGPTILTMPTADDEPPSAA